MTRRLFFRSLRRASLAAAVALVFLGLASDEKASAERRATLTAGDLEARIAIPSEDFVYPAGSKVRLEIEVEPQGNRRSRKRYEAEVIFEATDAKVVIDAGRNVAVSKAGNRTIVEMDHLRAGRPSSLSAEVTLGETRVMAAGSAGAPRLRLMLRDPRKDDSNGTTASWNIDHCARDFYQALTALGQRFSEQVDAARKSARAAQADWNGRWIIAKRSDFAASAGKSGSVCVEYKRRRGRERCVKWEKRAPERADGYGQPQPTKAERSTLLALDGYVRSRGSLPELGDNGRFRWLLTRVVGELKAYTSQSYSPAICTGAPEFASFQEEGARGLVKQLDELKEHADRMSVIVAGRSTYVASLNNVLMRQREQAAVTPTGADTSTLSARPVSTTTSIMTTQAIPASGEKPLRHDVPITVAELARQQLGTEDLERLKGESSLLRQLRLAEQLLDDAKKSRPARSEFLIELEANLRAALRAVEANHYAQSVSRRFGDVIEPIQKLIDQIRAAHTTHCTCQN